MKTYKNKFHDNSEWYVLREQTYDTATISIFRSRCALRSWLVTKTFSNGDLIVDAFTNEREAWQTYYGRCRAALDKDAMLWERDVNMNCEAVI